MKEKNKLVLQMSIFFILVVSFFTYLVINEKKYTIVKPKIETKLNNYINKNYNSEKPNLKINKLKYNNNKKQYELKINNKSNTNLYFYLYYKNKKIIDTYRNDYLKGNSLYKNIEKEYIKETKFDNVKLIFSKNLNEYPTTIYKKILTENPKQLPIYNIEKEFSLKSHTKDEIIKQINNFYIKNKNLGYNPKYYQFILVDTKDINFSVKVSNLTSTLIENNLNEIIYAIINNDKSIINEYNIKCKYLN